MTIALSKAQQEWLNAAVGDGGFASLDEAVAVAVQRMMLDDGLDDAELDWARPLVAEGIAQLEQGLSFAHDDGFDQLDSLIRAQK